MADNEVFVGVCAHTYETVRLRTSTGPNIFGQEVTAQVVDLQCSACDSETIKVIKADPRYDK